MEKLFVYGTLKKEKIQKQVFGRSVEGVKDILENYSKSHIKIENKIFPAIIQNLNSTLKGKIISITQRELKLIDDYETNAYQRKKVILKSGKKVWVYVKPNLPAKKV